MTSYIENTETPFMDLVGDETFNGDLKAFFQGGRYNYTEEEMDKLQIPDINREQYRLKFLQAEADDLRDQRKRLSTEDFEPLALIGRGAFGEVRLVRMRERFSKEIYAMKSMLKETMLMKNQVLLALVSCIF